MENVMPTPLTDDQLRAVADQAREPLRLIDPVSKRVFVLLDETQYERMRELVEGLQPRDTYAASDRVFASGWADPAMDDYDHYEELKK
jgi:hypothetical protein